MSEKRAAETGTGWRIGRAVALLVVAVPLAILGFMSAGRNGGWTEPSDGATWTDFAGHVVLSDVVPEGPAGRAGLRPGDLLESIDGREVHSSIMAGNSRWEGTRETSRRYVVTRDGRQIGCEVALRSEPGAGGELFPFFAIVGFFFLTLGVYTLFKLPRTSLAVPYFILSASLFAVLAISDTSRAETLDWILFWVDRAGRILAPAAFIHFVTVFLRRDSRGTRWPTLLAYCGAGLLGVAELLLIGFGRISSTADPLAAIALKDRIELGFAAVCFIGGIAALVAGYRILASRTQRRELRWMMWGTVAGLAPFTIFYLIPVSLGDVPSAWAPASALPMILLPLAFASALLRHRLGDIELLLKRGLASVSVAFFTLAAYATLAIFIDRTAGRWLGLSSFATAGIAALATAILYPQVRVLTRAAVDRIFYRGTYNFRRTLVSFGRELNSELDLDVLVGKIASRLTEALDFDRLALYLHDDASGDFSRAGAGGFGPARVDGDREIRRRMKGVSYLSIEDLAPDSPAGRALAEGGLMTLFPMRVKDEVCAFLAVGTRAGGEPLNSEDVVMLVALSAQASSALEAARLLRRLSEKVREVEDLRRTNENILESSRVAILVIDGAGVLRNCNRALEELTGVAREEAVGRPISDLYSLPFVREVEQLVSRATAEPGSAVARTFRSSVTNRAGERIRVNLAISALEGEPGELPGWVVTLDDVTEQVRLEERVLRQDRLAAIGLLASGVAHEVNTPLTGISSYAQMMLEETSPDDPRHELLRKMERQTARATSIVSTLLNFSRGGNDEPMESLDLAEVIEEALALVEPQFKGANLHLVRTIEPGLPRLTGHRGKLQQVLLNLLLNARDAVGSEGTVRIALRKSGSHLLLEVTDDGCGIPEADVARIFDPFFTTKSRGKGTGLGLSLSYNIVKEHRGELSVESRAGEGTVFTVDLPIDRRAATGR